MQNYILVFYHELITTKIVISCKIKTILVNVFLTPFANCYFVKHCTEST